MHPPSTEPNSTRLRAARLAAGLSLRALGRQIGCDSGTLSRIERGQLAPYRPLRQRAAAALGLEEAWLFEDAR